MSLHAPSFPSLSAFCRDQIPAPSDMSPHIYIHRRLPDNEEEYPMGGKLDEVKLPANIYGSLR